MGHRGQIEINGSVYSNPLKWEDIAVDASWLNGSIQGAAEVQDAELVLDAARIVKQHVSSGNIFKKLPCVLSVKYKDKSTSIIDGWIDCADSMVISDYYPYVKVKIKQETISALNERAEALSWDDVANNFKGGSKIRVCIDKDDSALEIAIASLAIASSAKEIAEQSKELAGLIADFSTSNPVTDPGSVFRNIAKTSFRAIYIGIMGVVTVTVVNDVVESIRPPQYTAECASIGSLIRAVFSTLGYSLKTNVNEIDLDNVLFPALEPDSFGDDIFREWGNKAYPTGYNADNWAPLFPIELARAMYNVRFAVVGKDVWMYRQKDPVWEQLADYKMPAVAEYPYGYNTDKAKSAYNISWAVDQSNVYTVYDYAGTASSAGVKIGEDSTLKGFEKVTIPACLAPRYNERNFLEELVVAVYEAFAELLSLFGVELDYSDADNLGCVRVSQKQFSTPHVFRGAGDRVAKNSKEVLSAINLYNAGYRDTNAVNPIAQYRVYKNVKIPFSLPDYQKLLNCGLFYDAKGNLCKIDSLKWNVFSDIAEIDYQQPEVYAQNLQITEYGS